MNGQDLIDFIKDNNLEKAIVETTSVGLLKTLRFSKIVGI